MALVLPLKNMIEKSIRQIVESQHNFSPICLVVDAYNKQFSVVICLVCLRTRLNNMEFTTCPLHYAMGCTTSR